MRSSGRAAIIILSLLLPATVSAAVIHVPGDYPTIQAGIDAAKNGDTVLLADGIYMGEGNYNLYFKARAITVCSENGPENCELKIQGTSINPRRAFTFQVGGGHNSVVRGLTIRHGYSTTGSAIRCMDYATPTIAGNVFIRNTGSAIWCWNASPLIEGNTFIENEGLTFFGGAIACEGTTPGLVIRNNLVRENSCYRGGGISCRSGAAPTIEGNRIEGNVTDYRGAGIYCDNASPVIRDNTITSNIADAGIHDAWGGGILCVNDAAPVINDNLIRGNAASHGGGVMASEATPTISGNTISGNEALFGGGIYCDIADPHIAGNRIIDNSSEHGAGLYVRGAAPEILNNLVRGNVAELRSGGIHIAYQSSPTISNCTITVNTASVGGGLSCVDTSTVDISSSIIWDNAASLGKEIFVGDDGFPSTVTIRYSDVSGGQDGVALDAGCACEWGEGMIEDGPLFTTGPLGDCYLSQFQAGQAADSPCVDTGDPAGQMIEGTTCTDHAQDLDTIDMGHHFPLEVPTLLVLGPGPGYGNPPLIRLAPPWQDAGLFYEFEAYDPDHYGVNVTTGDVTGDLRDNIITGPGPGVIYGPHVRGFGSGGVPLSGLNFLAYGTSKWGVNVATGNLDGGLSDEIITGAGPGAVFGPHVRGWTYDRQTVTPMAGVNFFAYGTPKWGVNVAAGDIDGDGFDEIVTGAGPGSVYGPHVRGWNYDNTAIAPVPAANFMAYGTNQFGVNVTCGDVDGDGIDEIVTAPGPGAVFGAHIRGWDYDGSTVTSLPGLSFLAWGYPEVRYGAAVCAGTDIDGDGRDDLVVGAGPDPDVGTPVKVYRYDGSQAILWFSLEGYDGLTHGVNVAAGRI